MKWLITNIKVIAILWWLSQGVLLFINELRVLHEYNSLSSPLLFCLSIVLIIISILISTVRNGRLILYLNVVLFLYSVFSFIFLLLIFVMEAQGNNLLILALIIPLINMFLSITLFKYRNK